jgi:MscS family membrane protein
MFKIRVAFVILLFACLTASGFPAEKPGVLSSAKEALRPAEQEKAPDDPLGRSTPQGTVFGFIKSATKGDYERAVQYLDTKKTGFASAKIISALQTLLERGFSGKLALLSGKPEGDLTDSLPPSKERIGTVQAESGGVDILLERIQRDKNPPIWVFSAETLQRVSDAEEEVNARSIAAYLPDFLLNNWFLWFALWQWIVILLVIPLAFFLATLLTRLIASLLLFYSRRHFMPIGHRHVVTLIGPLRIFVFAASIWVISLLSSSVLTSAFWAYMAATLTALGATWLSLRLIDIFFDVRENRLAAGSPEALSFLHLGRKLFKVLAVTIGALFIFFYIAGINLTAVIAGLGVGGVAVALAAQKTLENLFGGITVVSDQSVRVGDLCRIGDYLGTVHAVGLRSTQVRTLARTIVSIPNGQLALMNLENLSERDMIWFHHKLKLRYETTADQLRYLLAEIREMLYRHPKVQSSSARVRLIGFGDSSLDLEVFAYVLERDYSDFLHIQEDLLLRIMDIVAGSGSGFAFPAQTTYLATDAGIDAAKTRTAMETVRRWRENGALPFPDFSPERISEMDGKIEYPPPDSALRDKGKK